MVLSIECYQFVVLMTSIFKLGRPYQAFQKKEKKKKRRNTEILDKITICGFFIAAMNVSDKFIISILAALKLLIIITEMDVSWSQHACMFYFFCLID